MKHSKIIALLISTALIMGSIPAMVFAEGDPENTEDTPAVEESLADPEMEQGDDSSVLLF